MRRPRVAHADLVPCETFGINFPQTPLVELNERRPGFSLEKNGFTRVNGKLVEHIQHRPRRTTRRFHPGRSSSESRRSLRRRERPSACRAHRRVFVWTLNVVVSSNVAFVSGDSLTSISDSENPNRTHPTSRFTKTGSASLFVGILGWGRPRPPTIRPTRSIELKSNVYVNESSTHVHVPSKCSPRELSFGRSPATPRRCAASVIHRSICRPQTLWAAIFLLSSFL